MTRKKSYKIGRKPVEPDNEINYQIAQNLKIIRESHKYSQEKIADVLGVSYQQVQKYESGKNRIPLESLMILKDFYKIDYDLLFHGLKHAPLKTEADYKKIQKTAMKLFHIEDDSLRKKVLKAIDIFCR